MKAHEVAKQIIAGKDITKEIMYELYKLPYKELLAASALIAKEFNDKKFRFCSITNAKSGKCSEDCKYCAQSSQYSCNISEYSLLDKEEILAQAKKYYENGIKRFSIVTSGKRVTKKELEKLCEIYRYIKERIDIKLCASNGLLDYEDFLAIKEAGVDRIHNNLETSKEYFESICTTHTYDEKIKTIKAAKKAGLKVCSGGIVGMGETYKQRIDMAFELKKLQIESVPINFLNPIEGTPFSNIEMIKKEEFFKTCAIFKFILPKAVLRLAGGRQLLEDKGKLLFENCINGSITGTLLTTDSNEVKNDLEMIKELGYEIN